MDGLHLVRILVFEDQTKWIARTQVHGGSRHSKSLLLHEMHTLAVIRERTKIPVPKVLGYEINQEKIWRAFMIMEFIPGSTAMDAFGGWDTHHGEIHPEHKAKFCNDIAHIQVAPILLSPSKQPDNQAAMTSIRFPKIGMISKRADGAYYMDAIPGLGGPFDTAEQYFEAWAINAKFPMEDTEMRSQLPLDIAEEIIRSIKEFLTDSKRNNQQYLFLKGLFHSTIPTSTTAMLSLTSHTTFYQL